MKVNYNTHKTNADSHPLPNKNYLEKRIGFWALVKEVNSLNNTVTVVSDTGFEYPNIQVKSDEWVTVDNNKDYIPSQRNLPPVNSRVFVLTPTYTAVGAFILCSGFSRGDENIRTLWAQNDNEVTDKNNCRETKTQGGWDITEEYSNGNFKAESNDGNITINVNTAEDSQKSQLKEVSVTAWNNKVVINEDGISVVDKNGNTIKSISKKIFLEVVEKQEVAGQEVITSKSSLSLENNKATLDIDSKSKIEATTSSVKINNHLEVTL